MRTGKWLIPIILPLILLGFVFIAGCDDEVDFDEFDTAPAPQSQGDESIWYEQPNESQELENDVEELPESEGEVLYEF